MLTATTLTAFLVIGTAAAPATHVPPTPTSRVRNSSGDSMSAARNTRACCTSGSPSLTRRTRGDTAGLLPSSSPLGAGLLRFASRAGFGNTPFSSRVASNRCTSSVVSRRPGVACGRATEAFGVLGTCRQSYSAAGVSTLKRQPYIPRQKIRRYRRDLTGFHSQKGLLRLVAPGGGDESREVGAEAATTRNLAREIARVLRKKSLRLALHFDLNKTLIMVDPAGRKTQSQVLNSILAEICWGRVVDKIDGGSEWRWDGRPPSPERPSESRDTIMEIARNSSQTYSDYLHGEFPDAGVAEGGGTGGGEDENYRRMKDIRDARKGSFVEEGQPGEGLRGEYVGLEQALRIPDRVAASPLAEEAGLSGRRSYYVIPPFWECMWALKEAKADFSVLFRTFGSDIAGVAREHNAFCEGRHPLFPGVKMDGSDGEGDYRVHLTADGNRGPNVGAFYRDEEGLALVMGTLDNPNSRAQLGLAEKNGRTVYRNVADIHNAISEPTCPAQQPLFYSLSAFGQREQDGRSGDPGAGAGARAGAGAGAGGGDGDGGGGGGGGGARRCCLALRDYYPFWRSRLEAAEAGKLVTVDTSEDPKVWPVIFDDNVGRLGSASGAHIVDIRDAASGNPVPFDLALRRHVVRAEPFLALVGRGGTTTTTTTPDGRDRGNYSCNYFLAEVARRLPL